MPGSGSMLTYHCEHEFLEKGVGISFPGWYSEPFSIVSGLIMCGLALMCDADLDDPPLQFCLARASLVVCGLGTAAYHMLDQEMIAETRLNVNILDGLTMAMVTVNLFLLHLNDWMKRHVMAMSVLSMLYLLFWAVTTDMVMFRFLGRELNVFGVSLISIGLLYPSFVVVYIYILGRVYCVYGLRRIYPMWFSLFFALSGWALDMFVCSYSTIFFLGHAVWHMCVGYVAVYLMVLGLVNSYSFRIKLGSSKFWLQIEPNNPPRILSMLNVDSMFSPARRVCAL